MSTILRRQLGIAAAVALLALGWIATEARAELAVFGGLHGSGLSHFKNTAVGANDPIKGGLIGVSSGYQLGVDLIAGPIWFQPQFDMDYVWVGDYSGAYFERRYENPSLLLPLMYRKAIGGFSAGGGLFYKMRMSDDGDRDWGFTFAAKKPIVGRVFWNFNIHIGLQEQAQSALRQQFNFGLGFNLK